MMDLKVGKTNLASAMKTASRVVNRTSKSPLAASVLLRSDATISAWSDDVTLTARIDAQVKGTGLVALNAGELTRIASDAPGDDIAFKIDDMGWAEIRSGRAKYRIQYMKGADYPVIHQVTGTWHAIAAGAFAEALLRGGFAAATDEALGSMNGVLIHTDGAALRCASANKHRLALCRAEVTMPKASRVVRRCAPARWAALVRLAMDGHDEAELCLGDDGSADRVALRCNGVTISAPWLVDPFHSEDVLRRILEPKRSIRIVANRDRVESSIRRVSALTSEERGIVIVARDGVVTITTKDPDGKEISDETECDVTGEITIQIGAKYLRDAVAHCRADSIEILMSGDMDPVLVRDAGSDAFTAITSPMRL